MMCGGIATFRLPVAFRGSVDACLTDDLDHGGLDRHGSTLEIEVLPAESRQLADA